VQSACMGMSRPPFSVRSLVPVGRIANAALGLTASTP
jgi:hypothetical protein